MPPKPPASALALRGLSMTRTDQETPHLRRPLLDGLYEYYRRTIQLGREPA